MSVQSTDSAHRQRATPLAVVGSQTSTDEIIFGRAFDKWVITRFLRHLAPYKLRIAVGVFAVLIYTLTQLSIPLIVRATIDNSLVDGVSDREMLHNFVAVFFAVVVVNYIANHFMETIVGRTAQDLLFGLRRAMYAHLQHVSLSFMDKTEVGRLMSRLQGDVYALQEFLGVLHLCRRRYCLTRRYRRRIALARSNTRRANALGRADIVSHADHLAAARPEGVPCGSGSQQRH